MNINFSILIISYNRCNDLLDLLWSIDELHDKEQLLKEVIVVNNSSTDDYSSVEEFAKENKSFYTNYILSPANLGVSGGRNLATQNATGSHLLLIDDDILLPNKNMLTIFYDFFKSQFAIDNNVGILTPSIFYYATDTPQKNAFPHKHFESYYGKKEFLTSYFIGAAHIINKEVLEKTGLLPADFFYGMEEYDLSYRAIKAGYTLAYNDDVKIWHKESPLGRVTPKSKLQMMWYNKCVVTYTYLPGIYFVTASIMWSLFFIKRTGFSGYFTTWNKIRKIPKITTKNRLSADHLTYLKKVRARLWY